MKKLAFLLVGLVALQATAFAADDKPVKVTDLPQTAQQFISDHFSGHKVAMAKMDSELFEKSYEVIFTNGDKVEFDRSGEWTEVQYREGAVPAAIVPAAITKYVTENYPDAYIRSIERDRHAYEVNLSNRWEIKFDLNFTATPRQNSPHRGFQTCPHRKPKHKTFYTPGVGTLLPTDGVYDNTGTSALLPPDSRHHLMRAYIFHEYTSKNDASLCLFLYFT